MGNFRVPLDGVMDTALSTLSHRGAAVGLRPSKCYQLRTVVVGAASATGPVLAWLRLHQRLSDSSKEA